MIKFYKRLKEIDYSASIFLLFILVIIIFWGYEDLIKDYDCYIEHTKECLSCQKHNLTYLGCSGFCAEVEEADKNNICATHPSENCFDLPKECNIQ